MCKDVRDLECIMLSELSQRKTHQLISLVEFKELNKQVSKGNKRDKPRNRLLTYGRQTGGHQRGGGNR